MQKKLKIKIKAARFLFGSHPTSRDSLDFLSLAANVSKKENLHGPVFTA